MISLRTRTTFLLLLTFLSLTILPGCWSTHELNDEFILLAESVDKEGDQIIITTLLIAHEQSINGGQGSDSQSSSQTQSPVFILTGQGKSIAEAVEDYHSKADRYIYGGHLEVFFFSEEIAKEGIMPYLDLYSRHHWGVDSAWLVITHGPARDMLTLQNPMMQYITIDLEQRVKRKELYISNLGDFLSNYHSDSGMQVLTSSTVEAPKLPKGYEMEDLMVSNNALFRKDRLVDYLSPEEGKFYNYCIQGFPYTAFTIKKSPFSPQGKLSLQLRGNPPKIEATPAEEGLVLSIKVDLSFELYEDNSYVKQDDRYVKALEESVNENLGEQFRQLILHTQQEKLDVFNVADRLHATHSEVWQEVKDDWPEIYSQLPINIEVDARYRNSSTMTTGPGSKE